MVPGTTISRFFDQLLEASQPLTDFVIALEAHPSLAQRLTPSERRLLLDILQAYATVTERIIALIRPMKTEPAEIFWKGFALGLEHADRKDLLAEDPGAENAMVPIEAERLLADSADAPPTS